jgi:hypothetical protein
LPITDMSGLNTFDDPAGAGVDAWSAGGGGGRRRLLWSRCGSGREDDGRRRRRRIQRTRADLREALLEREQALVVLLSNHIELALQAVEFVTNLLDVRAGRGRCGRRRRGRLLRRRRHAGDGQTKCDE